MVIMDLLAYGPALWLRGFAVVTRPDSAFKNVWSDGMNKVYASGELEKLCADY